MFGFFRSNNFGREEFNNGWRQFLIVHIIKYSRREKYDTRSYGGNGVTATIFSSSSFSIDNDGYRRSNER